ncbi:MAG: 1-hydroxycarotenoid 3,4-desaturase CrtD [Bacteroidota bacterium]
MQKVVVIGAGIAGLASAVRLRAKGYEVIVLESNSYSGGKLHAFQSDGYKFDYGPSLFTMPRFVEELFELYDIAPEEKFQYHQKDIICNYFWEDGTHFSANANKDIFIQEAAATFSEPANNISAYLQNSQQKYDLTNSLFLEQSLHKIGTYLSKDTIKAISSINRLDLTTSLDKVNQRYFSSGKLAQFFNRFATYNGSNPYQTPGIMSLIPQLEMRFGTYYPKGGMHAISQSIYRLACEQGVKFHFNEKATSISTKAGKVEGVETEKDYYKADKVVCNMDVFSAYNTLLKAEKKPRRILNQERSSSAMIFYWGIKDSFPQLDLHNIFFSEDYKEEFRQIFEESGLSDDPTVYINITSKEEAEHAPTGCENWFVMINTPGNKGQDWTALREKAKSNILQKLGRMLESDIASLIETETVVDPVRIERDTLSHQGSLYGTSSNSKFAAFLRHPNFSQSIKNLYFCGGSAHPGGGIPLCLLSAKIVADQIRHAQPA